MSFRFHFRMENNKFYTPNCVVPVCVCRTMVSDLTWRIQRAKQWNNLNGFSLSFWMNYVCTISQSLSLMVDVCVCRRCTTTTTTTTWQNMNKCIFKWIAFIWGRPRNDHTITQPNDIFLLFVPLRRKWHLYSVLCVLCIRQAKTNFRF